MLINPKECTAFKPVEYVFPKGIEFKTYALKTSELHPDCNHPCNDPLLEKEFEKLQKKYFLLLVVLVMRGWILG